MCAPGRNRSQASPGAFRSYAATVGLILFAGAGNGGLAHQRGLGSEDVWYRTGSVQRSAEQRQRGDPERRTTRSDSALGA